MRAFRRHPENADWYFLGMSLFLGGKAGLKGQCVVGWEQGRCSREVPGMLAKET